MESFIIGTLNCGRCLKNKEATRDWLNRSRAQVICVQDVQQCHIEELFASYAGERKFVPMCNHQVPGGRQPVGVGIFSKPGLIDSFVMSRAYVGEADSVMDLLGVELDEQGNSKDHNVPMVRATESRLLVFADVRVGEKIVRVGTTHGPWVPRGQPDAHQEQSVLRMGVIVASQGPIVMAGDFNFSRNSPTASIYDLFLRTTGLVDCVPVEIDNTLDPVNHPLKGQVKVVSDSIFATPERFRVSDVQVEFGVSDHGAMTAVVEVL